MTAPLPYVGPQFDANSLCAEIDPEIWFPDKGGSNRAAKALCSRCENEDACLEWALTNDEQFGIFGGKSPQERKKILRERDRQEPRRGGQPKPINHGTEAGMKAHQRRGDVVPDNDSCGCRRAARLAVMARKERKAS